MKEKNLGLLSVDVYKRLAIQCRNKLEDVISNFKSIHGDDFDYSLITSYENNKQKLPIKCKKHDYLFYMSYNKHFSHKRKGCQKCKSEGLIKRNSIDDREFLIRAKKKHGDRFSYLTAYVHAYSKMKIMCNKCSNIFFQNPGAHLWGAGCPFCKSSKAEMKISEYLKNKQYFLKEYWFKDCRGKKRPLPFDFYLPDLHLCIEFDGIQHFRPIHFLGKKIDKVITEKDINNFLMIVEHDRVKTEYCQKNNIKLIRIPFWEFDNIENILEGLLS